MTTYSTIKVCPCQQSTHRSLGPGNISHQRHTRGYIIIIDLLSWCLGPRVVDRRVEGALRPFGVPRLVSLKSGGMPPRGQSLPHRGYSLPVRSSLIGYSVPNPDLLGPGRLSGHYAGPSYNTRHWARLNRT